MTGQLNFGHISRFSGRLGRFDLAAIVAAGLVFAAGFGVAPAGATTLLNPQVDFRAAQFSAANNQQSFSTVVDGIAFTLSAEVSGGGAATLWWDSVDGIGVRYDYENDEIEGDERLRLSFNSTIGLSELYISDLFIESGYAEIGFYQINGGPVVSFDALSLAGTDGDKGNGEHLIAFDPILAVNEIVFSAPGSVSGQNHEFALLGFTDPPIVMTEPATLAIFGIGLAGLGLARRRRRI